MSLLDAPLGPLAEIECRRAVGARWMRWARLLAALPAAGVVLIVTWIWMMLGRFDQAFLPGATISGGIAAIEIIEVLLVLLLGPALIAGSIAGEKDRGTLAMLLASELSPREIILGRLAGCFAQVGLLIAAALPMLVLLASFSGLDAIRWLLLLALPLAVAWGSAGLTIAASTLARRGRDALLTVFALEIVLVLIGSAATPFWLMLLNPFAAVMPLAREDQRLPALATIAWWFALGTLGVLVAVWQLRPAYYRQSGGESRRSFRRRRKLPAIGDRPMLWKELYLENSGAFGVVGRWLSRLFILALVLSSAAILLSLAFDAQHPALGRFVDWLAVSLGTISTLLLWLVQWMAGLRAVGVISSERQRATWDALLCSPLESREIIVAKICGSLYGLRWLAASLCLAWVAVLCAGQISATDCVAYVLLMFVAGGFMVVAGVSLGVAQSAASTTRGMAMMIGLWFMAAIVSAVVARLTSILAIMLATLIWISVELLTAPGNLASHSTNSLDWAMELGYLALRLTAYATASAWTYFWLVANFDRLAGRLGSWTIARRLGATVRELLNPADASATK